MAENVKKEMEILGINPNNPWPQMGKMVTDSKHLRSFLCKIPAAHRREAYNNLLPYLSFTPKTYWLLMR